MQVREAVVKQLNKTPDQYKGFVCDADGSADFAEFVADTARDRSWGGHVTLQAAADSYNVQFVVLSDTFTNPQSVEPHGGHGHEHTIYLIHFAEVHYRLALLAV